MVAFPKISKRRSKMNYLDLVDKINEEIEQEIEAAVEAAMAAPEPKAEVTLEGLFVE